MCKWLIAVMLILLATSRALAEMPQAIHVDPRTVAERRIVGDHVVTFLGMAPGLANVLPPDIEIASIDGQPPHFYRFPAPIVVADANQGQGNFPGVVSVGVGTSGNLILVPGQPAQAPLLDLNTSITLSSPTALVLSNTGTNTIQSQGGTVAFALSVPGSVSPTADVVVINSVNTPTGDLLRAQLNGFDKFSVDPSGDIVAQGNATAVNGSLSGTLSVSGNATLSGGTLTLGTSTQAVTIAPQATGAALTVAASANNTGGSGTVFMATALPTPAATAAPLGVVEIDTPGGSAATMQAPALFCKNGSNSAPCFFEASVPSTGTTDIFDLQAAAACATAAQNILSIHGGHVTATSPDFTINCNGNSQTFGTFTANGNITASSNGSIVEATPTINSTNTSAEVLPVYTAAGAITASTLHAVIGSCTFSTTACTPTAFSGSAVFSSSTSFACTASWQAQTTPNIVSIDAASGTSITITASASTTHTATFVCVGT